MKILGKNMREGVISLIPQTLEDLWCLEKVIVEGDLVSGSSLRTFKPESGKATKKKVFLTIKVEKVAVPEHANKPAGHGERNETVLL